ncbi:MAG: hypothetical protein R2940_13760 [Syntrophotaleaceae bacterium]
MSVPEILRLEAQLREQANSAERSSSSMTARKKIIAATMEKMGLIDDAFTGKLIISFKEGGVSYIEKVEQFK